MKILLTTLLFYAALSCKISQENDTSDTSGYKTSANLIQRDAAINHIIDIPKITQYIKSSRAISNKDAIRLALQITEAANCFKIDPYILTALIKTESNFEKSAVSHTGAAGLTQFTGAGIDEVNHQLGLKIKNTKGGFEIAGTAETIRYLKKTLKECVGKKALYLNKISSKPMFEISRNRSVVKMMLRKHPSLAIVSGAILLKVYHSVAVAKFLSKKIRSNNKRALPHKNASFSPLDDYYREALQMYNGDNAIIPGSSIKTKVKYANDVIKRAKSLGVLNADLTSSNIQKGSNYYQEFKKSNLIDIADNHTGGNASDINRKFSWLRGLDQLPVSIKYGTVRKDPKTNRSSSCQNIFSIAIDFSNLPDKKAKDITYFQVEGYAGQGHTQEVTDKTRGDSKKSVSYQSVVANYSVNVERLDDARINTLHLVDFPLDTLTFTVRLLDNDKNIIYSLTKPVDFFSNALNGLDDSSCNQ